jgi:hypothetical protein
MAGDAFLHCSAIILVPSLAGMFSGSFLRVSELKMA